MLELGMKLKAWFVFLEGGCCALISSPSHLSSFISPDTRLLEVTVCSMEFSRSCWKRLGCFAVVSS